MIIYCKNGRDKEKKRNSGVLSARQRWIATLARCQQVRFCFIFQILSGLGSEIHFWLKTQKNLFPSKFRNRIKDFNSWFYLESTITIRQCKNNDYCGLLQEYCLTYKILNNVDALENQYQQRENYLEFCQTSHIPRKDHRNRYFCTLKQ